MDYDSFSNHFFSFFKAFGFQDLHLPMLAHTSTFIKYLSHNSSPDLMSFKNQDNTPLSLRPDMTSLVIDYVVNNKNIISNLIDHNSPIPYKFYYHGPVFKKLHTFSKDNIYSYTQLGTEVINPTTFHLCESIFMAWHASKMSFDLDFKIRINNISILNYIVNSMPFDDLIKDSLLFNIKQFGSDAKLLQNLLLTHNNVANIHPKISSIIQKLDHDELAALLDSLLHLIDPNFSSHNNIIKSEIIDGFLSKLSVRNLSTDLNKLIKFVNAIFKLSGSTSILKDANKLLKDFKIPVKFITHIRDSVNCLVNFGVPKNKIIIDFSFLHSLNYYDGIIFNLEANNSPVCSGGAYFIPFHKKLIPSFGFSFNLDNLFKLTSIKHLLPSTPNSILHDKTLYVFIPNKLYSPDLHHIFSSLRLNFRLRIIISIVDNNYDGWKLLGHLIQQDSSCFLVFDSNNIPTLAFRSHIHMKNYTKVFVNKNNSDFFFTKPLLSSVSIYSEVCSLFNVSISNGV